MSRFPYYVFDNTLQILLYINLYGKVINFVCVVSQSLISMNEETPVDIKKYPRGVNFPGSLVLMLFNLCQN